MSVDSRNGLGPSTDAEKSLPEDRSIEETETPEQVEKTMEQTMVESLDTLEKRRRDEKDRSEQAFALETFYMHGGQELVDIFGVKGVLDAVNSLQQLTKGGEKTPNLLDVIKQLVPDSKERERVYDQMGKNAKDFFDKKSHEGEQLDRSGDAAGSKRFQDVYLHSSVGGEGNALRSKLSTVETLRRMDSVFEKFFASTSEKSTLNFATIPLVQEGFKGNLAKLREELTAPGREDFLITSYEMRSQIDKDAEGRMREATEIFKKSDQEIRRVTLELNNALAGRVNKILEDLQATLEKHTGSETGEKITASIAEAVKNDLAAFQQATDKEIEGKTAKLKEVMERASNAARPY